MKYISTLASLFLCINTAHAMEKEKKQLIQTVNVHPIFEFIDQTRPLPGSYYRYQNEKQCKGRNDLHTQTIMKGVDWDDVQLIHNGISRHGDVNYTYNAAHLYKENQRGGIGYTYKPAYTYPHNKLNLIQIACKEKKQETIQALLTAPNLNINAHENGTYPAIHLAIKRGDKDIIRLLFNFVGKEYCDFVYTEYIVAYNQYMEKPGSTFYNNFIHTEKMLHRFLRFDASHKQYALFTCILKEKYIEDCDEIPQELQQYITTLYYVLNIETVIANKYKHKRKYYDCSIKTKLKRRELLLKNPEPHLLWST